MGGEELGQHGRALGLGDPGDHLGSVVEAAVAEHVPE
jgi:hypothetical protein